MNFSPESQNDFIKHHLGPRLQDSRHADTRLLIYDQNRDGLEHWTDVIFADPQTAPYVFGVAVHWYASTFKVFEDAFDRVHAKFPDFAIIHTEGCIDNLGNEAPGGIADPAGFKESGWFNNDAFWWNANATDWAYTATWAGPGAADHPIYTPVHRYARNIIVSLDHWVSGWVDWNIVLDQEGGPNHVGNFCGAPIMIDTDDPGGLLHPHLPCAGAVQPDHPARGPGGSDRAGAGRPGRRCPACLCHHQRRRAAQRAAVEHHERRPFVTSCRSGTSLRISRFPRIRSRRCEFEIKKDKTLRPPFQLQSAGLNLVGSFCYTHATTFWRINKMGGLSCVPSSTVTDPYKS